jgi:hypothetical protein
MKTFETKKVFSFYFSKMTKKVFHYAATKVMRHDGRKQEYFYEER